VRAVQILDDGIILPYRADCQDGWGIGTDGIRLAA